MKAGLFAVIDAGKVSFKNDVTPIIHDYGLNCHEPGDSFTIIGSG